jgi:hypothetical protein
MVPEAWPGALVAELRPPRVHALDQLDVVRVGDLRDRQRFGRLFPDGVNGEMDRGVVERTCEVGGGAQLEGGSSGASCATPALPTEKH